MNDHQYFDQLFGEKRLSGILLHLTSLPGRFGIGDLGINAFRFADFLHKYNQKVWQILPLGPTGYGNSPYQCFSTFAGNPLLICPEKCKELNIISQEDIKTSEEFSDSKVEYERVIKFKWSVLDKAFQNYKKKKVSESLKKNFEQFNKVQQYWLDDYALFMSIKFAYKMKPWNEWNDSLKHGEGKAIEEWEKEHQNEVLFQKFVQFIFFQQWISLLEYVHNKKIKIFGDIPIFVAYDSADVWAHPELFYLDDQGKLIYVAGVPPDKFSETGQRWGNPLYRWDLMKKNGFEWWVHRIKHAFTMVDFLRIDHFRGFEAFWRIPANEPTAIKGKWCPGPGNDLFIALRDALGPLPIIAEDLGVITNQVEDLLEKTGYPGMRVLQFAFEEKNDESTNSKKYLPHNYVPNTVAYTGTHDNDTTLGWYNSLSLDIQEQVLNYTNSDGNDVVGDLIRLAWSSVAKISIIPLQDLLRLGKEARMNFPGTHEGNWEWRFKWEKLKEEIGESLSKLNTLYERNND